MNCQFVDNHLIEFLEEGLESRSYNDIKNHLAECSSCRQLVDDVSKTYALADKPATIKASDDFTEKTIRRLNKPEAKVVSLVYQVLKPIAVAASIGLGILIGNGELSILEMNEVSVQDNSDLMGLASPSDYSVWQPLSEEYGNED